MASRSINVYSPLVRPLRTITDRSPSISYWHHDGGRSRIHRGFVLCCAAQDSSTATVTDKASAAAKESSAATVTEKKEAGPAKAIAAPVKLRKALVKALPQMMEVDVIPSLKSTLEAEEDLSLIELSFQDNRLEGSFLKRDVPYYFWAFFPDGTLTGPKRVFSVIARVRGQYCGALSHR